MFLGSRRKRSLAMKRASKAIFLLLPALVAWHIVVSKPDVPNLPSFPNLSAQHFAPGNQVSKNDASALDLETDVASAIRGHTRVDELRPKQKNNISTTEIKTTNNQKPHQQPSRNIHPQYPQRPQDPQFSPSAPNQTDSRKNSAWHQLVRLLETDKAKQLQQPHPTAARFIIYRALGNDLPPRHARGQTLENVRFVLENEPKHPNLERRWLLNRLVHAEDELALVRLFVQYGERFTRDPVDFDQYAKIDFNLEHSQGDFLHSSRFGSLTELRQLSFLADLMNDKNQYIIHNNQARNRMLELGMQSNATYIMPFDGNCFLNNRAWQEIVSDVERVEQKVRAGATNITIKYFAVGMARMTTNEPLQDPDYSPPTAFEEPQIIFHKTAKDRFNEEMRYGKRPKVELLWRLQVKGAWDRWTPKYGPWADKNAKYSDDVPGPHSVQRVGWVARMFSGKAELERKGAANRRGKTRSSGVENLLAEANRIWAERKLGFSGQTLMWFDGKVLQSNRELYKRGEDKSLNRLVQTLRETADEEMNNDAVYTVIDKPEAPSGDVHDYVSAAPYYWPNPDTEDGFPFVRRDGERAPGTHLYGEKSEIYDRTRLASFSRNCTVLTLAGYFTGEKRYYEKAAKQVRTWFIDQETRMNPHLNYGQVVFKTRRGFGHRTGLIDFVNFAIVLDAVRLLEQAKALSDNEMEAIREWTEEYSEFLSDSELAQGEYRSSNNHGTLFDVQGAAVSAFVGDFRQLLWYTSLSRLRMREQFETDGSMPYEMGRKTQLHYMMYGLQAWVWLARISERVGIDMWNFGDEEAETPYLKQGMKFTVPYFSKPKWTHDEAEREDMNRMHFLYFHGKEHYDDLEEFVEAEELGEHVLAVPDSVFDAQPVIHDYFLVPPFWNLGMKPTSKR